MLHINPQELYTIFPFKKKNFKVNISIDTPAHINFKME